MNQQGFFKKAVALVVIYAFLVHLVMILPGQSEDELNRQFEKAKERFNSGQYANTKAVLERIIGIIDGKDISNRGILGKCYLLLGAVYEKEEISSTAEENYKRAKDDFMTTFIEGVDLGALPVYRKVMNIIVPPAGPIKKKKFPWLLVVGGVVVIGVTAYFLFFKPKKKNRLTVSEHIGVEGTPAFGSHQYERGENVSYTYRTRAGYDNLQVFLDGNETTLSGQITMDRDHTLTFAATANVYRLLVDHSVIEVGEGQTSAFNVQLSEQPAANVTVTTTMVSGDPDIVVDNGASLTFTSSNWNIPQAVTLRANEDDDITNGSTLFRIESQGLTPVEIIATENDNDLDSTLVISITAPENNDTISGVIDVFVQATGQKGIAKVDYFIDNTLVKTDLNLPYKLKWDSTTVADGPHTILATATDNAGQTVSDQVTVTVRNSPDRFRLTVNRGVGVSGYPENGVFSYSSGTVVNYEYQANTGYGTLIVALDGETVPASGTIVMDRDHTLTALAQSAQYRLTVTRGTGVSGTPESGTYDYPAGQQVSYEYTAESSGSSVLVYLDGQPVATSGNIVMDRHHSLEATIHELIFVTDTETLQIIEGRTDTIRVRLSAPPPNDVSVTVSLIDATGTSDIQLMSSGNLEFSTTNWGTYQPITLQAKWDNDDTTNSPAILRFTANNIPTKDVTVTKQEDEKPLVSFVRPQNGASVSGNVEIYIRALDSLGIQRIELHIDSTLVHTVYNSQSLSYTWSTATVSLGNHSIRAVAYDTGSQPDEEIITVAVVNEAPIVQTITLTPNVSPLTGTVTVNIRATDDRGVQTIRASMNGTQVSEWNQGPLTVADLIFQLNTTTYTNGVYTLRAVAVDSNGVESAPYTMNIAIQN